MNLLDLFGVSLSDICKPYADNVALYNQARAFYQQLESFSSFFLVLSVVLSIVVAWLYFGPYNNRPGRHYRLMCWIVSLLLTAILTFGVTFGIECLAVTTNIRGAWLYEIQIAAISCCYAIVFYLLATFVIHNWLPTNACRFFKF